MCSATATDHMTSPAIGKKCLAEFRYHHGRHGKVGTTLPQQGCANLVSTNGDERDLVTADQQQDTGDRNAKPCPVAMVRRSFCFYQPKLAIPSAKPAIGVRHPSLLLLLLES